MAEVVTDVVEVDEIHDLIAVRVARNCCARRRVEPDLINLGDTPEDIPAVRLNGTSDLPWERLHPELFTEFPEIQFLDYTKLRPRMRTYLVNSQASEHWPTNYQLTFSGDGSRPGDTRDILQLGGNVALVFWPQLPERWWDAPVSR